jgi:hypothetical protein
VALAGMLGVGWLINVDFSALVKRFNHPPPPTARASETTPGPNKRRQDEY